MPFVLQVMSLAVQEAGDDGVSSSDEGTQMTLVYDVLSAISKSRSTFLKAVKQNYKVSNGQKIHSADIINIMEDYPDDLMKSLCGNRFATGSTGTRSGIVGAGLRSSAQSQSNLHTYIPEAHAHQQQNRRLGQQMQIGDSTPASAAHISDGEPKLRRSDSDDKVTVVEVFQSNSMMDLQDETKEDIIGENEVFEQEAVDEEEYNANQNEDWNEEINQRQRELNESNMKIKQETVGFTSSIGDNHDTPQLNVDSFEEMKYYSDEADRELGYQNATDEEAAFNLVQSSSDIACDVTQGGELEPMYSSSGAKMSISSETGHRIISYHGPPAEDAPQRCELEQFVKVVQQPSMPRLNRPTEVKITQFIDPNNFFVVKCKHLEHALEQDRKASLYVTRYKSDSRIYFSSMSELYPGHAVVCGAESDYHRAVVISIDPKSYVMDVRHIDSGKMDMCVPISRVYRMSSELAHRPAYAIRCSMELIPNNSTKWDDRHCLRIRAYLPDWNPSCMALFIGSNMQGSVIGDVYRLNEGIDDAASLRNYIIRKKLASDYRDSTEEETSTAHNTQQQPVKKYVFGRREDVALGEEEEERRDRERKDEAWEVPVDEYEQYALEQEDAKKRFRAGQTPIASRHDSLVDSDSDGERKDIANMSVNLFTEEDIEERLQETIKRQMEERGKEENERMMEEESNNSAEIENERLFQIKREIELLMKEERQEEEAARVARQLENQCRMAEENDERRQLQMESNKWMEMGNRDEDEDYRRRILDDERLKQMELEYQRGLEMQRIEFEKQRKEFENRQLEEQAYRPDYGKMKDEVPFVKPMVSVAPQPQPIIKKAPAASSSPTPSSQLNPQCSKLSLRRAEDNRAKLNQIAQGDETAQNSSTSTCMPSSSSSHSPQSQSSAQSRHPEPMIRVTEPLAFGQFPMPRRSAMSKFSTKK